MKFLSRYDLFSSSSCQSFPLYCISLCLFLFFYFFLFFFFFLVVYQSGRCDLAKIEMEVKTLRRVSHPNIILYHNSWLDRENMVVIIITELMHSGTLNEYACCSCVCVRVPVCVSALCWLVLPFCRHFLFRYFCQHLVLLFCFVFFFFFFLIFRWWMTYYLEDLQYLN